MRISVTALDLMPMKSLSLQEVKQLHQAGHLKEAKLGYLELLKQTPKEADLYHLLGILCAEEGELDEAEQYLKKAIEYVPDDPSYQLHLANILKEKGLLSQAESLLLAVTKQYPRFSAAFNNLGTVYFAEGKWHLAADAFQSAIDIQSNYVDAYYNLGLALNKLNRKEEAFHVFSSLLSLTSNHVGAHFQLGMLLMQRKDYQKAAQHFSSIEKGYPDHFETQMNLAACFLKLGNINDAKVHYLKAAEINPDDAEVLFNLGVISMQKSNPLDAIKYYQRALRIHPDFYEVHNNLGIAYLAMKNVDQALLHFREVLRQNPTNVAIKHTIEILLKEKNLAYSPPEYITSLFDSYADHYDAHLIESLNYQAPQLIYQAIKEQSGEAYRHWHILDLGCGTGLCGHYFKTETNTIIGVDLSAKMLEVAAKKKIYSELIQTDILSFLTTTTKPFDLIMAGDVLVYFGDLATLFSAVRQALKPQGYFVFNLEMSEREDYHMTSSGRFAHRKEYVDRLALENHFNRVKYQVVTLRTQEGEKVKGHLYLLQI